MCRRGGCRRNFGTRQGGYRHHIRARVRLAIFANQWSVAAVTLRTPNDRFGAGVRAVRAAQRRRATRRDRLGQNRDLRPPDCRHARSWRGCAIPCSRNFALAATRCTYAPYVRRTRNGIPLETHPATSHTHLHRPATRTFGQLRYRSALGTISAIRTARVGGGR